MVEGSPRSRQECIDALVTAKEILGHSPSRPEYEELDEYEQNDWPSPSAIYRKFGGWNVAKKEAELDTTEKSGRKDVDSDYFSDIDSAEKAYWLGLLWADGCLSNSSLSLGLKDREHIQKFRDALNSSHSISASDGLHQIQIRCPSLNEDLIELGFTGDKTFDDSLPPLEDSDFQRAFVRGLFDGDGHFDAGRMRITSSSKGRLQKLTEWIGYGSIVYDRGDGVYTLQTPAEFEFHVYSWLYNTGGEETKPKLDRKYKKWTEQMLSI